MKLIAIILAIAVVAGFAPAATVQNRSHADIPQTRPVATLEVTPSGPITFTVVGDSMTQWYPLTETDYLPLERSWVFGAQESMTFLGGHAYGGKTLGELLPFVPTIDAEVAVIMGGTNDIFQFVPYESRVATLDAIVAAVGAEHVVISAVAPFDLMAAEATEWNRVLYWYSISRNLDFIDPWVGIRNDAGGWFEGMSPDGVHPSADVSPVVGRTIAAMMHGLYRA